MGAGTCEFLVDDRGEPVFLEMNTAPGRASGHRAGDRARPRRGPAAHRGRGAARVRAGRRDGSGPCDRGPPVRRGRGGRVPAGDRADRAALAVRAGDPGGRRRGARRRDHRPVRPDAGQGHRAWSGARRGARSPDGSLDDTVVLGLTTNLRFLRWLVREPVVRDGEARIDTLERIWPPDDWAERTQLPTRRGQQRPWRWHRTRQAPAPPTRGAGLAAQRAAHHPPRGRRPATDCPA